MIKGLGIGQKHWATRRASSMTGNAFNKVSAFTHGGAIGVAEITLNV